MDNEILNIDYHIKKMVINALNSSRTVVEASRKLGISERTIFRYMEEFKICRVWVSLDNSNQKPASATNL